MKVYIVSPYPMYADGIQNRLEKTGVDVVGILDTNSSEHPDAKLTALQQEVRDPVLIVNMPHDQSQFQKRQPDGLWQRTNNIGNLSQQIFTESRRIAIVGKKEKTPTWTTDRFCHHQELKDLTLLLNT